MKTNLTLKETLDQIRKLAVAPPPLPESAPTTHTNVPASNIGRPAAHNMSAIGKMQTALQQLAQTVSSGQAFDQFLAKHYLRNDAVSASVQFGKPATSEQNPSNQTDGKLSWAMDNMHQVAPMKGFVDRSWGKMTNDTLVNSYALAEGLLNVAKEFQLPVHTYTTADLAKLKPAIRPANDLTLQEKTEVAPLIEGHLAAIRRMYNEVKAEIVLNHAYRANVENKKPFIQYKQQNQELSPAQMLAIQQVWPNGFSVNNTPVQVSDLENMATIEKWVQDHPEAKVDYESFLSNVVKQAEQGVF